MGIIIYRLRPGKHPGKVRSLLTDDSFQVKVSCEGDIAVQPFSPENCDGVAWLLLSEGPQGEPGRDINGEVDEGPRYLQEQPGVLIGATDPRSLNAIIAALMSLRDKLADMAGLSMDEVEAEQSKGLQDIVTRDDLKAVRSVEDQETSRRGPTKTPWGKVTQ